MTKTVAESLNKLVINTFSPVKRLQANKQTEALPPTVYVGYMNQSINQYEAKSSGTRALPSCVGDVGGRAELGGRSRCVTLI